MGHYRRVPRRTARSRHEAGPVQLTGDGYVTLTAPFYPTGNALSPRTPCTPSTDADLAATGAFVRRVVSLSPLLQGLLTYEKRALDLVVSFGGTEAWCDRLRRRVRAVLDHCPGAPTVDRLTVRGMLFADGYGSVAVTLHLRGGWNPRQRAGTLAAFGPGAVQEALARELRSMLLPPAELLLRRCGAGETATATLPYYNVTYAGRTNHRAPGRSALHDDLLRLLHPDSPLPLASHSPSHEEFVFCGYGFNLLAAPDPLPGLEKLTLLLLVLNVPYARLKRSAEAAEEALQSGGHLVVDVEWLVRVEHRLRSEYQSLVSPIFSFDHHALLLRDAFLRSWDVARLQALTDSLLTMLQQTVERGLAAEQARRIRRVNLIITLLTILSAVGTIDAAISLFDRITR